LLGNPAWSADGSTLLIDDHGSQPGLWSVGADGSAPTWLLVDPMNGSNTTLSSPSYVSSDRIVFVYNGDLYTIPQTCGHPTTCTMSNATRLTTDGHNSTPVWTSATAASWLPQSGGNGGGSGNGGGTGPAGSGIPAMTASAAQADARRALTKALGRTFKRAHAYHAGCAKASLTRFTCTVKFRSGANDYWGTVTVYNTSTTAWNDKYAIHVANDRCRHSRHRKSCRVRTKRG